MTESQVVKVLREFTEQAGTQAKAAELLGVSQATVALTLLGKRPPEPKLLRGLGYERRTSYHKVKP